jgi:hypothetical protein
MLAHIRMAQVEFDEIKVPFIRVVRKSISERTLLGEIHIHEPVAAGRSLTVFEEIAESRKLAADVVKDTVENDPESTVVIMCDQVSEGPVVSQTAIDPGVIDRVVTVGHRFEERAEVNRIASQSCDMFAPVVEPGQPLLDYS